MNKCLYFICPTDNIEVIINKTFTEDVHFCNVLANNINFNNDTVGYIKDILEYKNIRKIIFVLSYDNQIVNNSLARKDFLKSKRLINIYDEIKFQKKRFSLLAYKKDLTLVILSYYLNKKVKYLKNKLKDSWFLDQIEIDTKIYYPSNKRFILINSRDFDKECFCLN